MLKCTINGKAVEVKEGTSIIEAFKVAGIDIAHYCWHPGLSVAGVCRLCMVEIEGNPRLQIACNTAVQEGMVINNNSEMVKDAVKWGLDFHLINHPLDCPICDQAGECGLQDQYMKFGRYDSEMGKRKVKKSKVVDLGEKIVLDSERCILCSRCVRFTEEVSKTNELGIFNRGDHSEIGTYAGKPLNNKYSVNTVDICPVGALTSKDFRFRQRVWFLKDKPSVCTGCSTGCNVDVYYNNDGVWRVQPRYSDVNGYWMCDEGRDIYKASNAFKTEFIGERGNKKTVKRQNRLLQAHSVVNGQVQYFDTLEAVKKLGQELGQYKKAALVLTGQYSVEEYEALLEFWKKQFGTDGIFHWFNHEDTAGEFDGLLLRGDKNPNTRGLQMTLEKMGMRAPTKIPSMEDFDLVVVTGPENQWLFEDIPSQAEKLSKAKRMVWLSAAKVEAAEQAGGNNLFIPLKTAIEKSGTFINFEGKAQRFNKVDNFIEGALSLADFANILQGKPVVETEFVELIERTHNEFIHQRDSL